MSRQRSSSLGDLNTPCSPEYHDPIPFDFDGVPESLLPPRHTLLADAENDDHRQDERHAVKPAAAPHVSFAVLRIGSSAPSTPQRQASGTESQQPQSAEADTRARNDSRSGSAASATSTDTVTEACMAFPRSHTSPYLSSMDAAKIPDLTRNAVDSLDFKASIASLLLPKKPKRCVCTINMIS